jgi:hypothetical protein
MWHQLKGNDMEYVVIACAIFAIAGIVGVFVHNRNLPDMKLLPDGSLAYFDKDGNQVNADGSPL